MSGSATTTASAATSSSCSRKSGPLSSRDIPDTSVVPWASTGWTNNRNVTQMLEFLMMRGEVAIAGRVGRERLWDLAERVYPADVVVPSVEEAQRIKNERRLASLGIARQKTTAMPIEPVDVGDAGEPAVVEGVKGEWRVDPSLLDDDFEGRTALLSPFDRLVYDRRPRGGAVRVRVHARDVQAGGQTPLGLFRAAGASRRPARREGRRRRRPQGLRAAGARDPRGREVHPADGEGRAATSWTTSPSWLGLTRSRRPDVRRRRRHRDEPEPLEDRPAVLDAST